MNADDLAAQVVSLRFPAEPKWLALCRLVLGGFAHANAVGDETVADLKLAVTEACSNSMRHAYGRAGDGEVTVRYEIGDGAVAVEVSDTGRGFEYVQPPPTFPPQPGGELREDEMGLAIINSLVDELDIGPGNEGRGTRVSFRKFLGSRDDGSGLGAAAGR